MLHNNNNNINDDDDVCVCEECHLHTSMLPDEPPGVDPLVLLEQSSAILCYELTACNHGD